MISIKDYLTFGFHREFYILFAPSLSAFIGITNIVLAGLPFVPPEYLKWTGIYGVTVCLGLALMFQIKFVTETTLSPKLNRPKGQAASFLLYLTTPLLVEYIIYVLVLTPEADPVVPSVNDISIAISLACVYAMFVAGRHYQSSISTLPKRIRVKRQIGEFKQAAQRVSDAEIGDIEEEFTEFRNAGMGLLDILNSAHTADGKQLHDDVEMWFKSVDDSGKDPVAKQEIIQTGDKEASDSLTDNYQRIIHRLDGLVDNR